MIKIKKIVLILAGIILPTLTTEILAVPSMSKGWYIDADLGVSTAKGKSYPGSSSTKSTGKGWSGAIGYKFIPFFALEADYTRYNSTRILNSLSQTAARDNHYAVDVTTKIIFPLMKTGLELYGKLGVAWIHSSIGNINRTAAAVNNMTFNTGTKTSIGPYWGAGVQYYIDNAISVHIQAAQSRGNSNTGNLGVVTAGLSFMF